jgi:TP901 family phage tail tape measure protein
MPTAADLTVKINADTSGAEAGINRVDSAVKGLGGSIGKALAVGAAVGLGAVAVGLGAATKVALGYEQQMANVNSILQLSDQALATYSDQLLQIAQNPGITQSPEQLAAGLYNVVSSGFAGADAMNILSVSAIAATAGMTDTDTSVRAVTSVLNAYGLQASDAGHISDLLFQTVQDGVLSFDDLANNMGNVLPVAASLGVSLDDVFAAYSQLTLQGINASAAETDIAGLMKSALNPTDAMTAAVQKQGFATADAAIQTLGLGGYVQLLEKDAKATGKTLYDYLGSQEAVNAAWRSAATTSINTLKNRSG